MNIYALAGIGSFLFYALSFAGVQIGVLDGNSFRYSALNTTAALLMLTTNFDQFNLASTVVSVFFTAAGVVGMTRHHLRAKVVESVPEPSVLTS